MKAITFLLTLAALVPAFSANDGDRLLDWAQTDITLEADLENRISVGEFRFTVADEQPVVVEVLKTSCGCTTAGLEKEVYMPGEDGTVSLTFDYGHRTGQQRKTAVITARRAEEFIVQETTLTLSVLIPTIIETDRRAAIWLPEPVQPKSTDEADSETPAVELETKTFTLTPTENFTYTFDSIEYDETEIQASARVFADGSIVVSAKPNDDFYGASNIVVHGSTEETGALLTQLHVVRKGTPPSKEGTVDGSSQNAEKVDAPALELSVDKTVKQVQTKANQTEAEVQFTLHNTNEQPLEIHAIAAKKQLIHTELLGDNPIPPGKSSRILCTVPVTDTFNHTYSIRIFYKNHNGERLWKDVRVQVTSERALHLSLRQILFKQREEGYKLRDIEIGVPKDAEWGVVGLEIPEDSYVEADLFADSENVFDVTTHDNPSLVRLRPKDDAHKSIQNIYLVTDHPVERYRRIPISVIIY